ncbi:hypothetical protein J7I98_14140 [Streptomyces sp. ISL-98]|uniref:DUF5999 family protein n=1 Tax=Streptomyces sp. ISL-98 TaxID=2819192 RepID=UPI001BE91334|nr:DUF5999 family protein [Streptomyces sp. ISL-98]MBT2507008.1 hypothetical protein [Streptomyces sp. ISL-98]
MCQHKPECPGARCPDGQAARSVAGHPEQGWCVNCIVLFEDTGQILPDGRIIGPQRLAGTVSEVAR